MPELPDVELYVGAISSRAVGETVRAVQVLSPFFVRSYEPAVEEIVGRTVVGVRRIGKRVVLELDGETPWFLVIHLMIAGRFRWVKPDAKGPGKILLARFGFDDGVLAVTEAGKKKRASLHVVVGEAALAEHDPGGLEVLSADFDVFAARLRSQNRTVKRALCDPRLLAGIGNAYSDEILRAAGLSPVTLTGRMDDDSVKQLFAATRETLVFWIEKLRADFSGKFPGAGDVTAFRDDFVVHGKFGQSCSICGTAVQRIRYAENETNYCPCCQTGGRVLKDRSLSRLLKDDWPGTVDEL